MSETAMVVANGQGGKPSVSPALQDTLTVGKLYAQSGYFADAREAAQGCIKIMAAEELGLPRILGSKEIYIVNGRLGLSAGIVGSLIKRSGKYNYRQTQLDEKACELVFTELFDGKWQEVGRSRFTIEDARKAGTKNTDKYPRNMLFARAMTNGARWYCPDVFFGPVYSPEELGATVDEDGQVIQGSFRPVPAEATPEVPTSRPPLPQQSPTAPSVEAGGLKEAMKVFAAAAKRHGKQNLAEAVAFIRETLDIAAPTTESDYWAVAEVLNGTPVAPSVIEGEIVTDRHGNRANVETGEILPDDDDVPHGMEGASAEQLAILMDGDLGGEPELPENVGVLGVETPAAKSNRSEAAIKAMRG